MWARKGIDRKREKERERKGEQNKRVNIQTSSRPSRYVCLHCESQSTFLREACCRCDCYEQECERDAIHIQTHQFRAQNKKPLSAGFTLEWRILCSDLHVQVAGSETGVLSHVEVQTPKNLCREMPSYSWETKRALLPQFSPFHSLSLFFF